MKQIFLIFTCLLFTMQAKAAESGDGWSLSDDGTLTISADIIALPWDSYRKSIKKVIINEGVTSIGNRAFKDCSRLSSINIPKSVTSIGDWAFYCCSSLSSITIPESVTSIGKQAFTGCSSLSSINIPSSVTSIGSLAFTDCSSLSSINISEGVTSIGDRAFEGCSSLSSINISEGVTSIGQRAFSYCSVLDSIRVDENNTKYDSRDNCNAIIETASNTLIAGCQNTIISESVTSIGDYAFYGCSGFESINIPESVTSIGGDAFSFCSGLTSINIPEGVTSIGQRAFYCCSGLTSIYSYATTPAKLGYDAFSNTNKNLIIYIPKGTKEAYKAAWKNWYNFVEMPASFEYDSNYGDIKLIKWTSSEADVMTIRIEPADGYELQSITLDGVDLLQAAEDATTKAVMNDDGTYTISGLSGDNLAVVVNFSVTTPVCVISSNQEAEIAAVYSLAGAYVGKSLKNLQNGLYIVVYSNGETDKVLVK